MRHRLFGSAIAQEASNKLGAKIALGFGHCDQITASADRRPASARSTTVGRVAVRGCHHLSSGLASCPSVQRADDPPLVREAQRHLVRFTLQPMAEVFAQEASDKLGSKVSFDLVSPLQASTKAGGHARSQR